MSESNSSVSIHQDQEDEVVIYRRGEERADDDTIWDDTELIQAYNKAVGLAYNSVANSLKAVGDEMSDIGVDSVGWPRKGVNCKKLDLLQEKTESLGEAASNKKKRKQRTKKGKTKQWKIGDLCLAKYSEDGEMYEAKIKSVDYANELCVVYYLGYDNEEQQHLNSLRPISEANRNGSVGTSLADETADDEAECSWTNHPCITGQIPSVPPPPLPSWMKTGSKVPSDQEALSSMLMSWYLSGYHTGYYQALREMGTSRTNLRNRSIQPGGRHD